MFCTQCGTPLKENQKFCTNCGARPETEVTALPKTTSQPSRSAMPPVTAARVPVPTSSSAPAIAVTSAEPLASAAAVEAPRPVAFAAPAPSTIAPKPGELEKGIGPSAVSRFLPWALAALAIVVVVGAFLFYRFSTSPQSVSDADIIHSIQTRFAADPDLSKCTVEVKSQNGIVTLTGLVNKESDKTSAATTAGQQPGVKQVNIYGLVVGTPISPSTGGETVGSNSAIGSGKTVTVPGNQSWTATGIFLNAGAIVQISASGGVSFSQGSKPGSPAGDPPDCLTVANGPHGWRAAPYVANQLPCSSLLGRVGENGFVFYVGAGTTFRAATPGQLYLGVNDNNFGDNSGFWAAEIAVKTNPPSAAGAAVKTNPPSTAGAQEAWMGFANGNVAQDRDVELRRNCGDFKRVYVPDNAGNKFTDLCGYVGKTCEKVCDWEGRSISCETVSQGGNRDGTRVAFCR